MKFKYLALAILPLAVAACQSSDIQKVGDLAVSVLQQQNADKILPTYQWSADTGAAKPLVLNFAQDGSLGISTSCNGMSTSWKIENNQIVSTNVASTLMACSGDAAKQEGLAASLFEQGKTAFVLNTSNPQNPTLTLTSAKGEKVVFTGQLTPETKYQSQGETIFLEISPETKECTAGVMKKQCLQVREIKYADNGVKTQVDKDWTLFYDNIDGFTHTTDERQVVRIKRYEIKNPAADQSKYAYVQDMIIEREAVKGSL
ncbi:DUF4377 domain-containing protein [Acinetobacter sichuanensis]|uniref:DUF4377 domain-containing protein n=1 Tax=Acinetobacter sichuanensis TaxID=2136183 RepID=A0A371YTZ6_9GAMM|nr:MULTISPECIES: META and DUF4377 domain-containing protein [Acinetobacter]MDM1763443.1 META and DUF4377 domain-containing protein [Acinetobacter sp. 226-1]MDM1766922.1 META and DUF4377 domain-containing protein [Acinetobacter sp. 226-4]MDQ9019639.1 META and DUF4377 domain-containing protein [Acinetobacter sichuanensis]RFC84940.1 DUF4377 domain-containing protein [Acinetobacter sichuanensis]